MAGVSLRNEGIMNHIVEQFNHMTGNYLQYSILKGWKVDLLSSVPRLWSLIVQSCGMQWSHVLENLAVYLVYKTLLFGWAWGVHEWRVRMGREQLSTHASSGILSGASHREVITTTVRVKHVRWTLRGRAPFIFLSYFSFDQKTKMLFLVAEISVHP